MAGYVPHHMKKRERLIWRETKLLRSIQRGEPLDVQLRLAEDVRLAVIRMFRAERNKFKPVSTDHADHVAALDAKIAEVEQAKPEQVLRQFIGSASRDGPA